MDTKRYSRQMMLPEIGIEGQQHLAAAKVLIVGLGGLGAPSATYLTGAGVGHIGLCDCDMVSISNLQRQTLYSDSQIGKPKTECAHERLRALNPDVVFTLHPEGLTSANASEIVAGYDLVVDCTDNFTTRFLIDDTCADIGIPWVYGAIGEFSGQVSVFNLSSCRRRFSDLFADRDEMLSMPQGVPQGVLGAVPGVVGAIQACEAIKLITNCGTPMAGKLFTIDMLTLHTDLIDF